ncbi:glycosyltransferase family 32 protein [Melanogaster broomeanus]|nr:glycosyltransferase family 32 protein [Melanogaster broomeanus]
MPRRGLWNLLKLAIPIAVIVLWWLWYNFEPRLHVDLVFYDRNWIAAEIQPITPLSGCFDPARVSPLYNLTDALYGKKRFEVQAGVPMRMGLDCYAFAGTVALSPNESIVEERIPPEDRAQYHTYWRTDLAPLDETARVHAQVNPIVHKYLRLFPDSFTLGIADIPTLAVGTAMQDSELLHLNDKKAWVDGDLVRLLVIWHYGGMWIDMDMLITRDLEPLLEHEFVTQWDCWGKVYQALNGALMHFRKHSPYLCEAFHLNGHVHTSSLSVYRLGRDSLSPFMAPPSRRVDSPIQDPALLFQRSPRL